MRMSVVVAFVRCLLKDARMVDSCLLGACVMFTSRPVGGRGVNLMSYMRSYLLTERHAEPLFDYLDIHRVDRLTEVDLAIDPSEVEACRRPKRKLKGSRSQTRSRQR